MCGEWWVVHRPIRLVVVILIIVRFCRHSVLVDKIEVEDVGGDGDKENSRESVVGPDEADSGIATQEKLFLGNWDVGRGGGVRRLRVEQGRAGWCSRAGRGGEGWKGRGGE